jgi:hypothetical protein
MFIHVPARCGVIEGQAVRGKKISQRKFPGQVLPFPGANSKGASRRPQWPRHPARVSLAEQPATLKGLTPQ